MSSSVSRPAPNTGPVLKHGTEVGVGCKTETEPVEAWLPVVGYEGIYEVSDLGRVRSQRRVLKGHDVYGYTHVSLGQRQVSVHRLVAAAFFGPPPFDGAEVDHKNGRRADNRPGNLEYVSRAENQRRRRVRSLARGHRANGYRGASVSWPEIRLQTERRRFVTRLATHLASGRLTWPEAVAAVNGRAL